MAGAAITTFTADASLGLSGRGKRGPDFETEGRNLLAHPLALAMGAFHLGFRIENDLLEIVLASFTVVFKNRHRQYPFSYYYIKKEGEKQKLFFGAFYEYPGPLRDFFKYPGVSRNLPDDVYRACRAYFIPAAYGRRTEEDTEGISFGPVSQVIHLHQLLGVLFQRGLHRNGKVNLITPGVRPGLYGESFPDFSGSGRIIQSRFCFHTSSLDLDLSFHRYLLK